jgi:hypothetical protein
MKNWLSIIFFIIAIGSQSLQAQSEAISKELAFARYLATNKQYADEVFVLESLLHANIKAIEQLDSVHYLLATAYYNTKILDTASFHFGRVSQNTQDLHTPSVFWQSYLMNHLGQADQGRSLLEQYYPEASKFKDLKNFQLAGNALLRRKYDDFDQYQQYFNGNHYQFSQQEIQLQALKEGLHAHKYKSPLLAGLMSAIVPGSGKIYAAKVGQGLATIMATTIMGIQTYESHRKEGPGSPRFIIYASLLSSFYIANIWGSVVSVNVRKREFDDTVNKEILFNMHIPLRTIFN